jgi:hypothetical protein
MRGRGLLAGVILTAFAACSTGPDESPVAGVRDLDTAVVSGVSFGYPAEWNACLFPGNVVFGELVEVRPRGDDPDVAAPLSVQVNAGAGSFREMVELDRISLDAGTGDYSEEETDLPGAKEALLLRYSGTSFGSDYAGTTVYALTPGGDVVKVTLYADPEVVDDLEPVLDATVESLDYDAGAPDSDLPACDEPQAPTPPPSPDTEPVPEEIEGEYEMTLTDEQLEESPSLDPDERPKWVLTLEGEVLKLEGRDDTGSTSAEIPVLDSAPGTLVVQGAECEYPNDPVPVTLELSVEGDELTVHDVTGACDGWLPEILTINVWRRVGG